MSEQTAVLDNPVSAGTPTGGQPPSESSPAPYAEQPQKPLYMQQAEAIVEAEFQKPDIKTAETQQQPVESFIPSPSVEVQSPVPLEVAQPSREHTTNPTNPKRKLSFGRVLAAGFTAASAILGSGGPGGSLDQPYPQPVPIVETVTTPPPGTPYIVEKATMPPPGDKLVDAVPIPLAEKVSIDDSLKCPASEKKIIDEGGSLARSLIEINGLGRYLKNDGTFNEGLIYKDILCTIYLPENAEQLEKSDPEMSKAIRSLKEHEDVTGPVTATMLWEVVKRVNEPRRYTRPDGTPSNSQLLLTYVEDTWSVADFRSAGISQKTQS